MINAYTVFLLIQALVLLALAIRVKRDLSNTTDFTKNWAIIMSLFDYVADKGRDNWQFIDLLKPRYKGDCEDPVLTVLRMTFGKWGMWWVLLTRRANIHYCTLNGVGHAVGEVDGLFFDCNRSDFKRNIAQFSSSLNTYRVGHRYRLPRILIKIYGNTRVLIVFIAIAGLLGYDIELIINLLNRGL